MSSFSFASTENNTIQMSSTTITDYISNGNSNDDKHHRAILHMRECIERLRNLPNHDHIVVSGISDETSSYIRGFKTHGLNFHLLLTYLTTLDQTWTTYDGLNGKKNVPKIQQRKKQLSVFWNKNLNKLRGRLTEESLLNDLMFMNGHHGLYIPEEGEPRTFTDIQTLERNDETDVRLHLDAGRIFADSCETMCTRLLGLLESVHDPNELCIRNLGKKKFINWIRCNQKETTFGVYVTVRWSDPKTKRLSDKSSRVCTNDPKFLEHFFGGSFPGFHEVQQLLAFSSIENTLRYPRFFQLVRLMKVKIIELINLSSRVPDSCANRYAVIICPRSAPILCGCETVILKPSSREHPYICLQCRMELCPWGCGRAHHGGDCEIPPDQASAELIAQTTKTCPGCNVAVNKIDGCNHMICRCNVHFCYLCGQEYDRDERGHYNVTDHHQDLRRDGRPRCRQFDH